MIVGGIAAILSSYFKWLQTAGCVCDAMTSIGTSVVPQSTLRFAVIASQITTQQKRQNHGVIEVPLEVIASQTHSVFCSHLKSQGRIAAILPAIICEYSLTEKSVASWKTNGIKLMTADAALNLF